MHQNDLEQACLDFYLELYAPSSNLADPTLREEVLSHIHRRIIGVMQANLIKRLSSKELQRVAVALAKERAPRSDGINIKFYTIHWDMLGHDFLSMVNQALANKSLPPCMTKGIISLIFKAGSREDLGNWRPITLFNTSYKVLAKALQLHLKSLLTKLIDSDQIALVPLCFILDNVLVT